MVLGCIFYAWECCRAAIFVTLSVFKFHEQHTHCEELVICKATSFSCLAVDARPASVLLIKALSEGKWFIAMSWETDVMFFGRRQKSFLIILSCVLSNVLFTDITVLTGAQAFTITTTGFPSCQLFLSAVDLQPFSCVLTICSSKKDASRGCQTAWPCPVPILGDPRWTLSCRREVIKTQSSWSIWISAWMALRKYT